MTKKRTLLFSLLLLLMGVGCVPSTGRTTTVIPSPSITILPVTLNTHEATPSEGYARCDAPRPSEPCLSAGHFILTNPIPAANNQMIDATYRFGSTQEGLRDIHNGVEFVNPSGTSVLAAADGQVVFAGEDSVLKLGLSKNFYGTVVVIEHHLPGNPSPLFTLYAHLSELVVATGDSVTAGEMIGRVGSSGSAVGSHLHFEVRLGENTYTSAVNPELWLTLTPDPTSPTFGALAGWIPGDEHHPNRVVDIRLEFSREEGGRVEKYINLNTYPEPGLNPALPNPANFALAGVNPGWYRVVFISGGRYYSQWVQVLPGLLTYLKIENE